MTTDSVGGVWTFTRELARELTSRGSQVVLAALGGEPSQDQAGEIAQISGVCLLTSDFKLEWMEDPWRDVKASGRWLLGIEQEYRPDLVHLNSFGHGALAWHTPTVLTAHSCVLSWWQAVRGEAAPAEWNRYQALVEASLQSVHAVTAPSKALAATLTENYALRAERCTVIPNGSTAVTLGVSGKQPLIFSAGRLWDEAKNAAALAVVAGDLAWPVYLAGEAHGRDLGACHSVGRLNGCEMAQWYAKAAIYALLAKYEPFGLSVLEAALSGCALVLGDIPSLRELWDGCAIFVAPDDHAALHDALTELIGNLARRNSLAKRSSMRARLYTSAQMAEAYSRMYERVVQCVT